MLSFFNLKFQVELNSSTSILQSPMLRLLLFINYISLAINTVFQQRGVIIFFSFELLYICQRSLFLLGVFPIFQFRQDQTTRWYHHTKNMTRSMDSSQTQNQQIQSRHLIVNNQIDFFLYDHKRKDRRHIYLVRGLFILVRFILVKI